MKKSIFVLASLFMLSACGTNETRNSRTADEMNNGDQNMDHGNHGDHGMGGDLDVSTGAILSNNGLAQVSLQMNSDTLRAGPAHSYMASIKFYSQDGMMLSGVQITDTQPWMITMGHGSFKDSLAWHQHDANGHHWMATGIQFSMGGEAGSWVMKTLFTVNGQPDSIDLPIPMEVGY